MGGGGFLDRSMLLPIPESSTIPEKSLVDHSTETDAPESGVPSRRNATGHSGSEEDLSAHQEEEAGKRDGRG